MKKINIDQDYISGFNSYQMKSHAGVVCGCEWQRKNHDYQVFSIADQTSDV